MRSKNSLNIEVSVPQINVESFTFEIGPYAHDKCDSLANATTAGGIFWKPAAAFQVGYYVAKCIDECFDGDEENSCINLDYIIQLSDQTYLQFFPEDPGLKFKFVWDGALDLIKRSRDVKIARVQWYQACRILRVAIANCHYAAIERNRRWVNMIHAVGMKKLEAYRQEHETFADTLKRAADLLATERLFEAPEPFLSVNDIIGTSKKILEEGLPEFEESFIVDVVGVHRACLTGGMLLSPADRFVNGDIAPDTFLRADMLKSPTALYASISEIFRNDVKSGLNSRLPQEFIKNII